MIMYLYIYTPTQKDADRPPASGPRFDIDSVTGRHLHWQDIPRSYEDPKEPRWETPWQKGIEVPFGDDKQPLEMVYHSV